MIHHSNADYNEAKSAAARSARVKLEEVIQNGRAKAGGVVEGVLARTITDKIVRTPALKVEFSGEIGGWGLRLAGKDGLEHPSLHPHAFSQVLADAGVPVRYAHDLIAQRDDAKDWGSQLVAHNLNTIFSHREKQRNLIRAEENGTLVKGFLSDKFRRIDSRPLLEQFVGSCKELGLVPVDGVASDTRSRLRAVFPKVFEPIADEVMVFFLEWGNSDYGNGGHVVNLGVIRLYCTNYAVADQRLRQVHLGKRLTDDIRYSEETYKADTEANILALKDIVGDAIGPERLNAMCQVVREAGEKRLKGEDVAAILTKALSSKVDVERVMDAYESHDVVNMPAGDNLWRLSNALSWVAQRPDISADRKIELQEVAGNVFYPAKKRGKAVEA